LRAKKKPHKGALSVNRFDLILHAWLLHKMMIINNTCTAINIVLVVTHGSVTWVRSASAAN
jgi:hypothetical protein